MKGDTGVPVADPSTLTGLRMAFEMSADGHSDRNIAQALNAAGYRTRGTHGSNLFTKDTVRAMLLNRLYFGELPGERSATAAPVQHAAVIERDLALLDMRAQGQASHLDGLAELLANVSTAWGAALPEQRNRLARLLFEEVVINDEQVAAVKPRPELAGFFLLDCQQRAGLSHACCTSGPDGIRTRGLRRDRPAC